MQERTGMHHIVLDVDTVAIIFRKFMLVPIINDATNMGK